MRERQLLQLQPLAHLLHGDLPFARRADFLELDLVAQLHELDRLAALVTPLCDVDAQVVDVLLRAAARSFDVGQCSLHLVLAAGFADPFLARKHGVELIQLVVGQQAVFIDLLQPLIELHVAACIGNSLRIGLRSQAVAEIVGAAQVVEFLLRKVKFAAQAAQAFQVFVRSHHFGHALQRKAVELVAGSDDPGRDRLGDLRRDRRAFDLAILHHGLHGILHYGLQFLRNPAGRGDGLVGQEIFGETIEVCDTENHAQADLQVQQFRAHGHRPELGHILGRSRTEYQRETLVELEQQRESLVPFHALDHGIERALPFGSVLVVELVLHAASQQGVYQETAAAGHQPRSPARTAFEYALELVGIYEIVDAPVDFGQHLAVGLDIRRRAVVYNQPLRRIVADKLRFIDPAGDFAFLDIPENLLFHRGELAASGSLPVRRLGRLRSGGFDRRAARRAEPGVGQHRGIAFRAHGACGRSGDGRTARRAELRILQEFGITILAFHSSRSIWLI